MKIYLHYKITEGPWGGGNTFMRSFKNYILKDKNIELAEDINDNPDIILVNAAHKGQGSLISIDELLEIKFKLYKNRFQRIFNKKSNKVPKIIYRSDGFRSIYSVSEINVVDILQKNMLFIADHIIFQNIFSRDSASAITGIDFTKNYNFSIIQNGTNQNIFRTPLNRRQLSKKIKVLSVNWSKNINKGYKEIAHFSDFENVESSFIGNWPESVDSRNVKLIPPIKHSELAKEMQKYDVLLHPSKNDACPNVCLEALSTGMPIIYHETSGIDEIAQGCGIIYNSANPNESLQKLISEYGVLLDNIYDKKYQFSFDRCAKEYIQLFNKL